MDPPATLRLDEWLRRRPWAADTVLAVALGLVLTPTSLSLLWRASWPVTGRVGVVAALVVAHLSLAARRISPVIVYAICCLVMLVLVALPDIAVSGASQLAGQAVPPILLPSSLVWPVSLYTVAGYARRPWPVAALVVSGAGALITAARLALPGTWVTGQLDPVGANVRLFVLAALLAAALAPWGLGRFRGIRAAYLEAMRERARREDADRAERARQAVADERARMAREMHDVVAHSLAVMVRLAEGGRCAATKNPRLAVDALTMVASTGREALGDMRGVMAALRGGPGGSSSVELQPQPTVDDVGALIEPVRAAGLTVGLRTTGSPRPLDRAVSLAAYRVVQECLTNVVKHAGPDATADVRLEWLARELVVTVADDGGGCPGPDAFAAGGQGLPGMRERVTLAGGRLTAGRRDDGAGGFTVRARLPVAPQPAPSRGSDEGGTA